MREKRLTVLGPLVMSVILAMCLLTVLASPAKSSDEDDLIEGEDYELDEAVVKLKAADPVTGRPIDAEQVARDHHVKVDERLPGVPRVFLFDLDFDSDELMEAQALAADPRVEYAEVNYAAEPPGGKARFRAREESVKAKNSANSQALASFGLSCARKSDATGAGATVAVLDTGAHLGHPALKSSFSGVPMYDFVEDEGDGDANPSAIRGPMAGHGTHVAGIVALVAPEAKIMPLRVLNGQGRGNAVAIAKAVAFARERGAHVINLSLSTPDESRVVDEYLDAARADGIVVVAAAGNDDSATMQYPAANNAGDDGLLAVTAVDRDHKKSSFASYGPWVDVAAPGNAIRSAYPVGEYANLSGTSMSTPFVAGEAALLDAQDPARTPAEIELLIKAGADPLDVVNPAYAGLLGAGEADAGASVSPATCS
jgi:subtilisin family serine protease